MTRLSTLLAVAAGALLSSAAANANVVFDTIGAAAAGTPFSANGNSTAPTFLAESFYLASPGDFNAITLALSTANPNDGGSISVFVTTDIGSGPEGVASQPDFGGLTQIGTILDSQLSAVRSTVTLPWVANPFAIGGVPFGEYWIVVTSNGDTGGADNPVTWYTIVAGTDGIGNVGQASAVDGLSNGKPNLTFGAFELTVDAPEPASIALLGAGMAGIGLARRRRAAKKA